MSYIFVTSPSHISGLLLISKFYADSSMSFVVPHQPHSLLCVSHLLEHLIASSSSISNTSLSLTSLVSSIGGNSFFSTSDVATDYTFRIPTRSLDLILTEFLNALVYHSFDPSLVETEIHSISSECIYQNGATPTRLHSLIDSFITQDPTLPYSLLSSPSCIPTHTLREQLNITFKAQYQANTFTFCIMTNSFSFHFPSSNSSSRVLSYPEEHPH